MWLFPTSSYSCEYAMIMHADHPKCDALTCVKICGNSLASADIAYAVPRFCARTLAFMSGISGATDRSVVLQAARNNHQIASTTSIWHPRAINVSCSRARYNCDPMVVSDRSNMSSTM